MEKILLLEPEPLKFEAIWGDGRIAKKYNRKVAPGANIDRLADGGGFGDTDTIVSGQYAGKTLKWLYDNHKEYFGTPEEIRWEDVLPVGMGVGYAAENLRSWTTISPARTGTASSITSPLPPASCWPLRRGPFTPSKRAPPLSRCATPAR